MRHAYRIGNGHAAIPHAVMMSAMFGATIGVDRETGDVWSDMPLPWAAPADSPVWAPREVALPPVRVGLRGLSKKGKART